VWRATLPVCCRAPAQLRSSRAGGGTETERVHKVTGPDIAPPPLRELSRLAENCKVRSYELTWMLKSAVQNNEILQKEGTGFETREVSHVLWDVAPTFMRT
jgi:hypothetical protein